MSGAERLKGHVDARVGGDTAIEIDRLQRLIDAYRLLAVNEGWNWPLADAYGHAEYLKSRIWEIDRKATGTVTSGYDAAGYLKAGLDGRA